MKFEPRNRFILMGELTHVEEDKSTILLPEEYKVKVNPYGAYQILQIAEDCTKVGDQDIGKLVIVNDTMVETISVDQGSYVIVLENYVYGVLG